LNQLLRLLVTLLAFGVLAGGAVAAQPGVDDGAPAVVFAEGDGGDDEGEGEGDEGEGKLAPRSDDGADKADDETDDETEKEEGEGK
jgi:hypothetical protein